jgi:hypothetical protein
LQVESFCASEVPVRLAVLLLWIALVFALAVAAEAQTRHFKVTTGL